jgi:predicted aspartyl protease
MILLLTSVAGCGASGSPVPGPGAKSLPLTVRPLSAGGALGASMVVRVTIGSHGFPFVVDTGAERSVIAASVARDLHLRTVGPARTAATLGCRVSTRPVRLDHWRLGSRSLPAETVAAQNELPAIEIDGQPLSGLLGADVLSRFGTMTLDYDGHRLILGGTPPTHGRTVPLVQHRNRARLPEVRASIDGTPGTWMLDTGSPNVLISADRATALALPRAGTTESSTGAADCTTKITPVRIGHWRMGTVPLPPTVAASSTIGALTHLRPSLTGVIGSGVLASFGTATVDFTHHRLTLGG